MITKFLFGFCYILSNMKSFSKLLSTTKQGDNAFRIVLRSVHWNSSCLSFFWSPSQLKAGLTPGNPRPPTPPSTDLNIKTGIISLFDHIFYVGLFKNGSDFIKRVTIIL